MKGIRLFAFFSLILMGASALRAQTTIYATILPQHQCLPVQPTSGPGPNNSLPEEFGTWNGGASVVAAGFSWHSQHGFDHVNIAAMLGKRHATITVFLLADENGKIKDSTGATTTMLQNTITIPRPTHILPLFERHILFHDLALSPGHYKVVAFSSDGPIEWETDKGQTFEARGVTHHGGHTNMTAGTGYTNSVNLSSLSSTDITPVPNTTESLCFAVRGVEEVHLVP